VKVADMPATTHNPSNEIHWASCLRENLTSSSYGEGLETDRGVSRGTAPVPYPTNILAHRFYTQHGMRIFEPAGCDRMIAHIDKLREKLMTAYNRAQSISELLVNGVRLLTKQSTKRDP
jgi:hypothetical protein